MKTCQEFAELYELYALNALDPEEQSEIEEHLEKGCPVCSDGIKRAAASMTFLATMPEQLEPPTHLRKRVLASVGIEKSNWRWIAAFAASIAALIVAIIWFSGENRRLDNALVAMRLQMERTTAQLANAQAVLQFLSEPETKQVLFGQGRPQPPRGRVLLNSRRGVLLIASNLPPAPSGKTYELWVIPNQGTPLPAGLFQSSPQGDAQYLHGGPVDLNATGAVAVTLEPASGSNAPTTTPIFVVPLTGL